ncbi:winged helix-turn-helix domain-containing protein [Plantactinospora sp. S1510]|uniref:Winged helix-turn-helix domain-containing protein n=1 Tax=Plantactinospora alkalitolerans TaxID=2789879 RepID=A0ABS0GTU4_9ACTN|nr:AfsR/SARP family transcriptional regulator [Plantactinospora alkalitolerans]MBF9129618.1 winged helix-turn-helix domain-containing protein [Plantactinospora alkalitolerans]
MLEFRLLGDVDVHVDGHRIEMGPARQRSVLVALLVDANEIVSVGQLLDRVWADRRPQRARETLYSYLSRLRHRLSPAAGVTVTRRSAGYLLTAPPDAVDLHRFRGLVRQARNTEDDARALPMFDEALGLWRGEAFAHLENPWLSTLREALGQERFAAELDRRDIALRRGLHGELLPELTRRAAEHPLDERLAGQLLLALYRSGRQADALDHYARLRRHLADTLGVDPGPELRQLHLRMLHTDPGLTNPAGVVRAAPGPAESEPPRPHQLPPTVADFTGRRRAVGWLENTLSVPSDRLRVIALSGPAGVGKSSLAWYVAHRLRQRYPDGQLYADLRGSWPDPVDPLAVLGRFLRVLGVPDNLHHDTVSERAGQFRDAVHDRRLLVVVDDARSAAQVRPLLPGGSAGAVIVTSRQRLTGLEGAAHLGLATFEPAEAVGLLERIVGSGRVATEPEAVAEIARLCGYLPLAVRIAAARLAARPHWRLGQLAERLRDELNRLDELATDDLEVRASLGLSYRSLAEPARRMLRLSSLLDAPDVPAWIGAAMLDVTPSRAEGLLESLVDASLLELIPGTSVELPEPTGPSVGEPRYGMHDLVRLFARERAAEEEPEQVRRDAVERAFGAWLAGAEAADGRLPTRTLAPIRGPARRWRPTPEAGPVGDPVSWFDRERVALVASIHQAADLGLTGLAWNLAASTQVFYELRGMHDEARQVHEAALRACRRAGERRGEAVLRRNLADLWTSRRGAELREKLDAAEAALRIFRLVGEPRGVADSLWLCADVYRITGRHREAAPLLAEAMSVSAAAGYELGECHALAQRAIISREQGRDDVTRDLAHRYLDLARGMGARRDESTALTLLGLTYGELGRPGPGETYLRQAVAVARETGDHVQETYALARLGHLYALDGHPSARHTLETALARSQVDGLAFGEALSLAGLGELELVDGRPARAVALLRRVLQLLGEPRFHFLRARALTVLGHAYASVGDNAAAGMAWSDAYALFRQIDNDAAAARVAALLPRLPVQPAAT